MLGMLDVVAAEGDDGSRSAGRCISYSKISAGVTSTPELGDAAMSGISHCLFFHDPKPIAIPQYSLTQMSGILPLRLSTVTMDHQLIVQVPLGHK